jgi:hypothetical protein
MRNHACLPVFALLALAACAVPARAEDRSLVFVFGPVGADHVQAAAQAAAASARNWLKVPGATVEIRRRDASETQELSKFMAAKDVEAALLSAASASAQIDVMAFFNTLDKATYAVARHPGKRVVTVIVQSPALSVEAENRMRQTIDFCRSNSVRVVVIDPSATGSVGGGQALKALATETGGVLTADPQSLEANLLIVAPVDKAGSEMDAPKAAATVPAGVPVFARLIRKRVQFRPGGLSDLGPTNGALLVETPIAALQLDDKGGSYLGRAVLTAMVKNAAGKTVWQAKKEFTLKGPSRKLAERRTGNVCLIRDLQLPGGQYTIEAAVQDVNSGKSGNFSEPLRASPSLPGFTVSDALFVRNLNGDADKFEGDQVLSYEGRALAPLLDPAFQSGQMFNLEMYFILYPDIRGGQPDISIEILRDGQVVGRTHLPFTDRLHDSSRDNPNVGSGARANQGEQKSEFPYLASIRDASFSAGQYEARLTVRQDKQTITRSASFRVTQ